MNKIGVLLINLGTPSSPTLKDVKHFLREFLSDPYVIDLPALIRTILVNAIIIPFRSSKTLEAYQKVWTEKNSPLLHNTLLLKEKLQKSLGKEYLVEIGMRYGNPNLEKSLNQLIESHCNKIVIIPLYPQYALATTSSTLNKVFNILKKNLALPPISILTDFFSDDLYIYAISRVIQSEISSYRFDHILFSYHGIPERQIDKISNCQTICNKKNSCPELNDSNRYCYRAQCFATSQLIAKKLGLNSQQYSVSFQSRLGKTPWLKPYTDIYLNHLLEKGVKNLAIVSPSFVCDCLETLEEIGIRLKKQWLESGGKTFQFISCLNDNSEWITTLNKIIKKNLP